MIKPKLIIGLLAGMAGSVLTTSSAYADGWWPELGDSLATVETTEGQPKSIEQDGDHIIVTWTTKYDYYICCDFDDKHRMQSAQLQMTDGEPMQIRWLLRQRNLWTGTKDEDWQELPPRDFGDGPERCFVAVDKRIEAFERHGGANLLIVSVDWINKLKAEGRTTGK